MTSFKPKSICSRLDSYLVHWSSFLTRTSLLSSHRSSSKSLTKRSNDASSASRNGISLVHLIHGISASERGSIKEAVIMLEKDLIHSKRHFHLKCSMPAQCSGSHSLSQTLGSSSFLLTGPRLITGSRELRPSTWIIKGAMLKPTSVIYAA